MAIPDLTWQERSECRKYDTRLFQSGNTRGVRTDFTKALEICLECPVMFKCLEYALRNQEPQGMWGGMDPEERNIERKRRAQQPVPAAA